MNEGLLRGANAEKVFDLRSNRRSGPEEVEKSLDEAAEAVTSADLASTRMEERSPILMIAAIM